MRTYVYTTKDDIQPSQAAFVTHTFSEVMRGISRIARNTRSVQSEERKHTLQTYNSKQPDSVSSAVGDMFLDRESC